MFNIGDKIVYPMHGVGTIETIEEKDICGDVEDYYIIKMDVDGVKAMVPTAKATNVGIRHIANIDSVDNVFNILNEEVEELVNDTNWSKRYLANCEKIKAGHIEDVAKVYKDLSIRHNVKGLAVGEKKMLTTCKNILISELAILKNESYEMLDKEIEDIVTNHCEV